MNKIYWAECILKGGLGHFVDKSLFYDFEICSELIVLSSIR